MSGYNNEDFTGKTGVSSIFAGAHVQFIFAGGGRRDAFLGVIGARSNAGLNGSPYRGE